MPMLEKYRHYFDIDPDYFPAVNEAVITKNPEVWKKFFPHETFVKLLKNTISVLERKQKLCLWVEGAYGTGKSHAVHTLKKLLDSSEEETREYFQRHKLDNDLCNRFQAVKSSGRILTVHRYGSATIRSDHNLVFAIQESIEKALVDAGIENKGGNALKEATITWLSDKDNKNYFNGLITGTYANLFGGDDADTVIEKLRTFSGDALAKVMDNIFKVADERQVKALSLSVTDLSNWIREVIRANSLKAIVFMWDEFTEYFYNNARNLTGFQELCEISETDPFYFVLVTHVTQGLFHERDQDFIKLNGRFVSPHSLISLPENIAFQLMGAAMEKNQDEAVLEDWELALGDLTARTQESRKLVKSVARITDKEMVDILPIHPYAALLLKHISSAFDSNQRSMFDFIKNDRGDEIKGFQWFIDNFGPEDDNPLLSVDMLWEFFYDKGKEYLAHDIRSILDYYNRAGNQRLDSDQKRVLKTVLLLQAISQYAGDSVELFIPNEKNLDNAFEGTDMEGSATRCAEQLVREKVLFSKSLGGGKFQYAAYNHEDEIDVTPFEKQIDQKSTSAFITEELSDRTRIVDAITLGGALKLRYELRFVSASDFDSTIKQLRNTEEKYENKIVAVVCFAKDDAESVVLGKKIHDALSAGTYNMIFIDASRTPFGADGYGVYRHDMALSMSQQGKDNTLATQYANNAKDSLKKWKARIVAGEFIVHTADTPDGERATTLDALYGLLAEINKKKFVSCLEGSYNVIANMYTPSSLKQGVECAFNEKTAGTFQSGNSATKLETALDGAWKVPEYWKSKPHLLISKIKVCVDGIINDGFQNGGGRVSIKKIYDVLKAAPYGFMPCNLSAFILGFVLKEYASGTYSWSDGLTNDVLNVNKLKEMIDEVIRLEITPNPRYKDKYIVAMTPAEKAFNEITSVAFGIPLNMCTSVPNTRERIRSKMKEFSFPIWTLKYILEKETLQTKTSVLSEIIDSFCGIANSNNMGAGTTDSDIAMAIGNLALTNRNAANDLQSILTKEKCTQGMAAYLETFENGTLVSLAQTVGDGGQYINVLRKKFDADAANWVWNVETAQQKIREVILEYQIIVESNKIISKNISYDATIREWCDKCGYIRISYVAAKNYLDELGPFLGMLYTLKKAGTLLDSQKQTFLELVQANESTFRNFYNIMLHYKLPQNVFLCASDAEFCKVDEFPIIPNILERLASENSSFFISEISSFFMLEGEKALVQELKELLSMSIAGHAVILTFQCAEYLRNLINNDRRFGGRVCILGGEKSVRPRLVFTEEGIKLTGKSEAVKGLRGIAKAVESAAAEVLYIETHKSKDSYPFSLYAISDLKNPYEVLCHLDGMTAGLAESYGSKEEWQYALAEFQEYPSWQQLISAKIGSIYNLDIVISTYQQNSADKKWLWLYFIGLKLFHASNDSYLNKAIEAASSPAGLVHNLYRTILEVEPTDSIFAAIYERRKAHLNAIGNPLDEVNNFCKIVQSKGKYALYYLTDNTIQEKELIFKLLDRYSEDFDRTELFSVLERIYPDLHAYLTPYRFKNELLDSYFQEYKYQKVVNKIFPNFMELVEKQAVDRDYNIILRPRSSVIEGIDVTNAQTYFTDALGVEYLGYIMARCHALELMAKITVCRCELPSITSRNKEFWDVLSTEQFPIITVDKIDKIKHHGEEGYDYSREDRKLPIHLIRELELIDELLKKVKTKLTNGDYQKAILIADHGASRLAVIHETENLWEMESKGEHSGRCCPKSEIDVRPDSATDAEDFWALANYDRFRGSRKANVEAHGGATLEEITVPIIEISYLNSAIEVKIMPLDSTAMFTGVPEITVSFRKKAAIKVFSTEKLVDVSVVIDGHVYEAKPIDENFYVVEEMAEIRRAKTYSVDVFAGGMPVATDLPLRVKKESGSEKNIL